MVFLQHQESVSSVKRRLDCTVKQTMHICAKNATDMSMVPTSWL
ncbi:hypothetical protein LINGRAHAP2_LOCUS18833 [Linum grandiflorum]